MLKKCLTSVAAVALLAVSAHAADLKFKPDENSDFHWKSYHDFADNHDLKGQTLTIFGPWRGQDEDLFQSVIAYFEEATGAKVDYSSSENYEQQIVIDTQAGNPPNIAILPQPGLIQDLASKGLLTPLGQDTADFVQKNYAAGDSWKGFGTYTGKDGDKHFYALPYKADLKSLVWYVPANFQDAGYEVPKTMEDLKKLTQQIVDDGGTPWCIGLGSGGATGWPATDWVEDILLRQQDPSVYDKWVTNEIPFDDPKIVEAIKTFGWFAKNPKFVAGGPQAVATTDFREAPNGLFSIPPKCFMHKQAQFISDFFPENVKVGQDVDFFYFPPYGDKDLGRPVLGAGTLAMITKDSKAAEAFIDFLKTPISHEIWMAQTGFLTPFKQVNTAVYTNDVLKREDDILLNATTYRFDGSDLMPGKIGAGAFWKGMVDFVGGMSAKQSAEEIQKAWDAIK
ncbi:ABC transporter substrate-binding protein [Pararhizobium mangrovi]|uniref:Carbohydrate ABC transporter substrate-binding protein n=1 Tax=Pararhizobium mangrovi TaxID=2590452 RepID=A0A506U102_9HYPH|nr:ABC transporter substrate-binding protein [Pararhizobium mangrovi]TPW27168.1 carbohydrate ABC transporter substrate-binding protein [Pararhizobium mangrovi]